MLHLHHTPQRLIGQSAPSCALLEPVARVGPSEASVLLPGESGTGKELVARAVHEASARAGRPPVVVDCASLSETLFESELFGHEKGASTRAHAARPGLVQTASGGTLFLDEVGDIPSTLQVKLRHLLESGSDRCVGSSELRRADLHYRIATVPIALPPLRERRDDLPLLAQVLLARLAAHPFPANLRELRNLLERAARFSDGEELGAGAVERALAESLRIRVRTLYRKLRELDEDSSVR